jgi:hypothetical protein
MISVVIAISEKTGDRIATSLKRSGRLVSDTIKYPVPRNTIFNSTRLKIYL